MPPTQKIKSSQSRMQMKKLKQILKNQSAKIGDSSDLRSRTVDQVGGTAQPDSDEDNGGTTGARRKGKAKRKKEMPLKLDYTEMRDDDEDDYNLRGGADSEPDQDSPSEADEEEDNLSEDGKKLKEQMADAQARFSEGKSLLTYNIMEDDDEEELK